MVTGSGWVAVGCWMSFTGRVFKEQALKAEGHRERGRENWRMGKGEIYYVGRDIAVMCLQRWFCLPKHSVISHEVGELREVVISVQTAITMERQMTRE